MTSHDTVFNIAAPLIRPGAIAILFFVLAAMTLASETEATVKHESRPALHKVALDGNSNDWNDVPVIFLEDSLHVVSIAHDDHNLYLMYRFADERRARQLMKHGVMLWINGDGKPKNKHEEFAVRYPGSEQISEHLESQDNTNDHWLPDGSDRSGRQSPSQGFGSPPQIPGQLTVIRMALKDTGGEDNPDGPSAASSYSEGSFCYELRIPFAEIGGKVAETDPSKKRKIAIGIQIGGLTKAEKEMRRAQSAMREPTDDMGGMGGGRGGKGTGGGGRGGGMGGGRGGGTGGGRGDGGSRYLDFDPKIEWLSLTLPPATRGP
ncbi:MAG: hypothetical protein DRJ61_14350 [Acidobacteria bacterium]|nr:MAG: hypothetical protein DRJ65_18100 [Acidobacteriota bacterium]RLE29527.1 MAG: hypothetical protein DRJ61_14350 [Acidobacteriota bacterium]